MGKKKKISCGDLLDVNGKVYDCRFVCGICKKERYFMYLNVFRRIVMNGFGWKDLGKSCSEEMLEKCLCEEGKGVFLFDEKIGFLRLGLSDCGRLNIYGNGVRGIGYWGYGNYRDEC